MSADRWGTACSSASPRRCPPQPPEAFQPRWAGGPNWKVGQEAGSQGSRWGRPGKRLLALLPAAAYTPLPASQPPTAYRCSQATPARGTATARPRPTAPAAPRSITSPP